MFREYTRKTTDSHPQYTWLTSYFAPTGVLSFRIVRFYERDWKDGKLKLEEQLPNILAQLELIGLKAKADSEERDAWHREYERKRKEEQDILVRKQNELSLYESLAKEAKCFNEAQVIRNYVREVENRIGSETLPIEKNLDWIKWAKDKADWIDPLVEKKDILLGDFRSIIEAKKGEPFTTF